MRQRRHTERPTQTERNGNRVETPRDKRRQRADREEIGYRQRATSGRNEEAFVRLAIETQTEAKERAARTH